nr:FprA family A-type flavoprotein [Lachnospiraceae bacterium]
SKTTVSELVSRAFEYSALVFASATYNAEIFDHMHTFLTDLENHNLSNRTVGVIENGSWAPTAGKKINEILANMKNMTVLEPQVSLLSSLNEASLAKLDELADALAAAVK